MKAKYIIFFVIILPLISFAQVLYPGNDGIMSFSAGGASISWDDENAPLNNQAGIINEYDFTFTASALNLYNLPGLNALSTSVKKNINPNSAVAVSLQYFGDSDFNQQLLGLAYARRLMKNWSLSLQADVLSFRSRNYGSSYKPNIEIGSLIKPSEKLAIGIHFSIPLIPTNQNQYGTSVIRLGGTYHVSDKVALMAELKKDLVLDFELRFGLSYQPVKPLNLRIGFQPSGSQFFFGTSYAFSNFSVQGTAGTHNSLGTSFGGGIAYAR